jgi:hypothetical protein
MTTISQGEAVFQAVRTVFTEGAVPSTTEWNSAQKETVHHLVFKLFKSGATVHKSNPDDAALLKYIPGLVNNWVRKDKRLNGGSKYEAKNPGSRAGSGDPMVREMKALLSTLSDPEQRDQVQAAIDERMKTIKPTVTVDASKLPASLRHLIK